MSENGIRLSGKPIWGGYVLWKENLSELQEILKELEDRKEELKDANLIEEEKSENKKNKKKNFPSRISCMIKYRNKQQDRVAFGEIHGSICHGRK